MKWRRALRKEAFLRVCLLGALLIAFSAAPVLAQETPIGPKFWPSKWGPDDEKGSFNTITPQKVLSALKLVKDGKIYRLGMPYSNDMPLFGNRTYTLHIPGLPAGGPFGTNQMVWNDEFVCAEIGQVGTQFDGPGHVGLRVGNEDIFYNGMSLQKDGSTYGLKRNGVEKVGPCITRGVLVDVVGLKGVEYLEKGYVITPEDLEAALKKQGTAAIKEGDAVLIRTGWIKHWKDPATFNSGEPGVGVALGKYLVEKNISLVASDCWGFEAVPPEDPNTAFVVHNIMETANGVWALENLNLDALAKDGVYEFLFIFVPVPFVGATGSPGDAIAIR